MRRYPVVRIIRASQQVGWAVYVCPDCFHSEHVGTFEWSSDAVRAAFRAVRDGNRRRWRVVKDGIPVK
jgi:hypothetical protein